jgi:hypothetical protein
MSGEPGSDLTFRLKERRPPRRKARCSSRSARVSRDPIRAMIRERSAGVNTSVTAYECRIVRVRATIMTVDANSIALAREAALAAEHIAIGATALGKARFDREAYYAQAFFALSTGLERAGKIGLLLDLTLERKGEFPVTSELEEYRHDLRRLLDELDAMSARRGGSAEERLPRTPIHSGIIGVLTDFAKNVGRYYNLNLVTGCAGAVRGGDPIAAWRQRVTVPVLAKHYPTKRRLQDVRKAHDLGSLVEGLSSVALHSEGGDPVSSFEHAQLLGAEARVARPWERMYVLQVARFITAVLVRLSDGAREFGLEQIPDMSEFFAIYLNDDDFFRSRRTLSIYPG